MLASSQLSGQERAGVRPGWRWRRFQAGTIPFDRIQPAPTAAQRQQLDRELAAVNAALDAVSDALTAESVYQLVRGDRARAAATVDAVATGEIAPPDLHVFQTPADGGAADPPAGGPAAPPGAGRPPAGARQARAAAEPALEPWLRQLLGDVGQVRFGVEFLDGYGVVHAESGIPLSRFGLPHVDVLYFTAAARPGKPSDLERLLDYQLRRAAPDGAPTTARVGLVGERHPDLPPGQLGLTEYLEVMCPVRETVPAARGIEGRDLTAEPPQVSGMDIDELGERADADRWDVEILERTLLETHDPARLRTLDPQVLSEDPILYRGLPALYVSVNVAGEAQSTDFIAADGTA